MEQFIRTISASSSSLCREQASSSIVPYFWRCTGIWHALPKHRLFCTYPFFVLMLVHKLGDDITYGAHQAATGGAFSRSQCFDRLVLGKFIGYGRISWEKCFRLPNLGGICQGDLATCCCNFEIGACYGFQIHPVLVRCFDGCRHARGLLHFRHCFSVSHLGTADRGI